MAAAGIELPALLAATKADEAPPGALAALRAAAPDLPAVAVSILDDGSLEALKEAIWRLIGLIRVRLRHEGETDADPLALEPGATVADVAAKVHRALGETFRGARVWGPSARFDGQRVGRDHAVEDGDAVEIVP